MDDCRSTSWEGICFEHLVLLPLWLKQDIPRLAVVHILFARFHVPFGCWRDYQDFDSERKYRGCGSKRWACTWSLEENIDRIWLENVWTFYGLLTLVASFHWHPMTSLLLPWLSTRGPLGHEHPLAAHDESFVVSGSKVECHSWWCSSVAKLVNRTGLTVGFLWWWNNHG